MRSYIRYVVFINLLNALTGILYLAGFFPLNRTPANTVFEILGSLCFLVLGVHLLTKGEK